MRICRCCSAAAIASRKRGVLDAPERLVKAVTHRVGQRRFSHRARQRLAQRAFPPSYRPKTGLKLARQVLHQPEPIFLRAFQRPLMRQHIARAEGLQLHGGEKSVACKRRPGPAIALLVRIKGRRLFHHQRLLGEPLLQRRLRARIAIFRGGILRQCYAVFQANDVMRIARVQRLLFCRRDDIIRRREHRRQVGDSVIRYSATR